MTNARTRKPPARRPLVKPRDETPRFSKSVRQQAELWTEFFNLALVPPPQMAPCARDNELERNFRGRTQSYS